jgi:putative peptide zinc metalloprotease protein
MPSLTATPGLQGRKQVRLRLRRNLIVVAQPEGGRTRYVIKDPVSLRYFRLDERQRFIVERMDGRSTLEEIQRAFEELHRPERLPLEELEGFAAQLVNNGLAQNDTPLASPLLREQAEHQRRSRRRQKWLNFLCIKVPLFDPDRLLTRLLPWLGWLFRPVGMVLGCAVALLAVGLLLSNWPAFLARLPTYRDFFTPGNAVALWLAYVAVKVLHELGHGLCCRVHGGEVHEVGVLLVLPTPVLYCNTSDAWQLPGKWQRIAVSAAGIHVELLIAGLATFLWWATDARSLPHHVAFSLMIVCSVSTVAVNANPLLRFDGYYALVDWLDVPNLSEAGAAVLRARILRWFGVNLGDEGLVRPGRRTLAAAYAAAAFVYRWAVLAVTLYLLSLFLQPYRLGVLCVVAAAGAVGVGLVWPLLNLIGTLFRQRKGSEMKLSRFGLAAAAALLAGAFVVLIPIPRSVEGLAVIQIESSECERVTVPDTCGFLSELRVEEGQVVKEGQVLAVLKNPKLQIALQMSEADQRLRVQQEQAQVAWLTETRGAENGLTTDLAQTRFELVALRKQHQVLKREAEGLTLRAPRGGLVLGRQPAECVGKWLERGTELCRVGDPGTLRAVLLLDPADHQRIEVGNAARIHLHGSGARCWQGVVSEVARVDARSIPPQLSSQAGGEVATQQDADSRAEQPRDPHYLVAVRLAEHHRMLHPGSMARVRIDAEPKTLWWQARRLLALTFNWGL